MLLLIPVLTTPLLKTTMHKTTIHKTKGITCWSLILLIGILSVGCGTLPKDRKQEETLNLFRQTLRFSEFEALQGFMDAEYLEEHPITSLEVNRLKQFQVSGYKVRSVVAGEDGETVNQVIELRFYNIRTAAERQVLYHEDWRWHDDQKAWRLHSGLPKVTGGR